MVILLVFAWMRHEEKRTVGEDRRLEGERAAIREREVALAARLASERGDGAARRADADLRARLAAPASPRLQSPHGS